VTPALAMALGRRGYRVREEFLHLVFPLDGHDENAWGKRLHIPLQLGLGHTSTATRGVSGHVEITAPRYGAWVMARSAVEVR
jgi:hypothetical protein